MLESKVKEFLIMGEKCFEGNELEKAKFHFDKILKITNSNYDLRAYKYGSLDYIGRIFKKLEKYDQALTYFSKIQLADIEKHYAGFILAEIGDCHAGLHRYDRAIKYIKKGLKLYQEDGKDIVIGNLAYIYRKNEKFDDSIKYYQKLINNYPMSLIINDAYYGLGISYYFNKKHKKAEKYFSLFLKNCNEQDELILNAHYYLAHLYYLKSDYQQSIVAYNLSLNLGIDEKLVSQVHLNIAVNFQLLGKFAIAIKEAEKALTNDPNFKNADYALALISVCAHKLNMIELRDSYKEKLKNKNPESKYLKQLYKLNYKLDNFVN